MCAQLGSVAATYALEHLGGQSHAYTWDEFKARYRSHFPAIGVGSPRLSAQTQRSMGAIRFVTLSLFVLLSTASAFAQQPIKYSTYLGGAGSSGTAVAAGADGFDLCRALRDKQRR